MTNSKIYLNVPFAQKDSAKALGAKWDAINKKWYVPANLDISPFAKWHSDTVTSEIAVKPANSSKTRTSSSTISPSTKSTKGVMTHPADTAFVAYNGEDPPWD